MQCWCNKAFAAKKAETTKLTQHHALCLDVTGCFDLYTSLVSKSLALTMDVLGCLEIAKQIFLLETQLLLQHDDNLENILVAHGHQIENGELSLQKTHHLEQTLCWNKVSQVFGNIWKPLEHHWVNAKTWRQARFRLTVFVVHQCMQPGYHTNYRWEKKEKTLPSKSQYLWARMASDVHPKYFCLLPTENIETDSIIRMMKMTRKPWQPQYCKTACCEKIRPDFRDRSSKVSPMCRVSLLAMRFWVERLLYDARKHYEVLRPHIIIISANITYDDDVMLSFTKILLPVIHRHRQCKHCYKYRQDKWLRAPVRRPLHTAGKQEREEFGAYQRCPLWLS